MMLLAEQPEYTTAFTSDASSRGHGSTSGGASTGWQEIPRRGTTSVTARGWGQSTQSSTYGNWPQTTSGGTSVAGSVGSTKVMASKSGWAKPVVSYYWAVCEKRLGLTRGIENQCVGAYPGVPQ